MISFFNTNNRNVLEENMATIDAMCRQEQKIYRKADYLAKAEKALVDADCRKKMVAWCFQVVDFLELNRESVEIAISHVDRFLSTPHGETALHDKVMYTLVVMTALYTAIKIHEQQAIDLKTVALLSRKAFNTLDVKNMESTILHSLNWNVNPPTASSFLRYYLRLIPENTLDEDQRSAVYLAAKQQIEVALADYTFVDTSQSFVAYLAIESALQAQHSLNGHTLTETLHMLAHCIESHPDDMGSCYGTCTERNKCQETNDNQKEHLHSSIGGPGIRKRQSSFDISPRTTHSRHV